jgi:hypothetical protein
VRRRRAGFAALGVSLVAAASAAASFSGASSNPSNSFAAAANFCANPGTQTVGASQDAYINSGSPNGNFGGSTQLIETPGVLLGLGPIQSLVQFGMPTVPSRCTLTGATLRLYATSPAGGRTIRVARAGASWSEGTVTWNNAPAATGAEATSASLSSPGWQSWNVLAQVQAIYSGTNNGLRVFENAGLLSLLFQQVYQSREGSPNTQDPELQLTFG